MCTGTSLAMLAAGTGMSLYGNEQREDAMQQAAEDEIALLDQRQDKINKERDGELGELLKEASRSSVEDRQDNVRARLNDKFAEADDTPAEAQDVSPASALTNDGSVGARVIANNRAQAQSEEAAKLEQEQQALAELDSLSEAFARMQIERQPKLETVENLSARSGRLNQYAPGWIRGEAMEESDTGSELRTVGTILSSLGSAGLGEAGFLAGAGSAAAGNQNSNPYSSYGGYGQYAGQ